MKALSWWSSRPWRVYAIAFLLALPVVNGAAYGLASAGLSGAALNVPVFTIGVLAGYGATAVVGWWWAR